MSENALAIHTPAAILEKVVVGGDLIQLTSAERLLYYQRTCESLGLNPLTRPFEYITLNQKLTLYARRDATDQIRKAHSVNVTILARELVDGVYVVTAKATMPDGRTDESIGAVPLCREDGDWKTSESGKRYFKGNGRFLPLSPEDRANAIMKAETKAKRRVTLSIVGLGILDETELETVHGAKPVTEAELNGNGHKAEAPKQRPTPPAPAKVVDEPQQRVPWNEDEVPAIYIHNALRPPECGKNIWDRWCQLYDKALALGIKVFDFEPKDTQTVTAQGLQLSIRIADKEAELEGQNGAKQGATA